MKNPLVPAEDIGSALLQYGIAGAVLGVFVAPAFWLMFRRQTERDQVRESIDAEERRSRVERENKLVDALVKSVEQQRDALATWRTYEAAEEKVHTAILSQLAQLTASQNEIARLLSGVAEQMAHLRRSA